MIGFENSSTLNSLMAMSGTKLSSSPTSPTDGTEALAVPVAGALQVLAFAGFLELAVMKDEGHHRRKIPW
jgi:hypothetical protein